jgi:hypothetical protein
LQISECGMKKGRQPLNLVAVKGKEKGIEAIGLKIK